MVLSENEDITDNNNDGSEPFDPNNPNNIFTSVLYCVPRVVKPSELDSENWFKAVDLKFEICRLWDAVAYQTLFVQSDVRGINNCLSTHKCQTMFTQTLVMLNNFITDINIGQDLAKTRLFCRFTIRWRSSCWCYWWWTWSLHSISYISYKDVASMSISLGK